MSYKPYMVPLFVLVLPVDQLYCQDPEGNSVVDMDLLTCLAQEEVELRDLYSTDNFAFVITNVTPSVETDDDTEDLDMDSGDTNESVSFYFDYSSLPEDYETTIVTQLANSVEVYVYDIRVVSKDTAYTLV